MKTALIGHTGFVGSNLAHGSHFDLHINRLNLEELRGCRLERVVCAGLPAAKWLANLNPQDDISNMRRLEDTLRLVRTQRFILISTIDVYARTTDADEAYDGTGEENHAYGRHRLAFEKFVRLQFPHACIVRLPALFGPGLKKNVVFDLLHDHQLDQINPASRFQWYPVSRLTRDLRQIEAIGLPLVNLFPEPIETGKIVQTLFGGKTVGTGAGPVARYDLRTRYGAFFGGDSRYVMTAENVMTAMQEFVGTELRAA